MENMENVIQKRRIEILNQWEPQQGAAAITTPYTYEQNVKALLQMAKKDVKIILQENNPLLNGSANGIYDAFYQALNRGVNVNIITDSPFRRTWIRNLYVLKCSNLEITLLPIKSDVLRKNEKSAIIVDDKFLMLDFYEDNCIAFITKAPEMVQHAVQLFQATKENCLNSRRICAKENPTSQVANTTQQVNVRS